MNHPFEKSSVDMESTSVAEGSGGFAGKSWPARLESCGLSLENVLKSSEKDFMDLGEKLIDFYRRAMEMSDVSQSVLQMMTGNEFSGITQDLAGLLDELRAMMADSGKRFDGIVEVLNRYKVILSASDKSLDDFIGMVINLNILGLFTRVENAHVTTTSDSGFASLTSDVKRLAQEIKIKSHDIRQHSGTAAESIVKALSVITSFANAEGISMRSMLDNIIVDYDTMTNRYGDAVSAAEKIASMSTVISNSTGRIVESLQFHDISRQRIEHVVHTIRSLCDHLDASQCSSAQSAHLMKNVCGLQKAQLIVTGEELMNALNKVKSDLVEISQGADSIVRATSDVALMQGSTDTAFMHSVYEGIETLMTSLDKATDEEEGLLKTVRSTCEQVSYMTEFVKEIESLGEDLQLVALNARIKAAHLGTDGAALDAISNNIYAVSQAASQETLKLSGILGEVADVSENFEEELGREREAARESARIRSEKMTNIKTILAGTTEKLQQYIDELRRKGRSLINDIEKSQSGVNVHHKMQEVLQEVVRIMEDILADALLADDGSAVEPATEKFLNDLNQLYTMESERSIHSEHTTQQPSDHEQQKSDAEKDDSLPDNIELF